MKRRAMHLAPALAMVVMSVPSAALAAHEVPDERPTTLEDFREDVGSWIDPWLANSESDLADDHAPLVAISLYEELLSIRPEPCYWDAYAAYWAVAASIRAMGQAATWELMVAETERVFEDVARAEALAELDTEACATWGSEASAASVETTPTADTEPRGETGSVRVIEIEATPALQFVDEGGQPMEMIGVRPGETVVFRVHNRAGFEHSFHIGTESELEEPEGTTDAGIEPWTSGVRELEWVVPDDVGLMFGCTIPGHFSLMHGGFRLTPAGGDTLSD